MNLPEVFLQLFLFSVSCSQEEPEATGTEGDGTVKDFIYLHSLRFMTSFLLAALERHGEEKGFVLGGASWQAV